MGAGRPPGGRQAGALALHAAADADELDENAFSIQKINYCIVLRSTRNFRRIDLRQCVIV